MCEKLAMRFSMVLQWVGCNCAAIFGAQAILAADQAADIRPNIVLFLVDDLGVMDTSVPMLTDSQGKPQRYPLNDFYRTPNLERLVARGVRFADFHAMSVCSPTRISLMTGQNAARHRTTNWIQPDANNRGQYGPPEWNWQGLSASSITLPSLLKRAGYRTIHVGKGHFGPTGSVGEDPRRLGFDINVGGGSMGAPGSYYSERKFGRDTPRSHAAVPGLEAYFDSGLFLTEALTRESMRLVSESVERQEPFFLHLAHYAVHAPFEMDPRFQANYANSGVSVKAQAFAALVEGVDRSLGDLMQHLHSLGVAENTLILFLGDNGSDSPLGEAHDVGSSAPLRGKKGSHYQGGTQVPFVAAWLEPSASNPLQQQWPIATGAVQQQLANCTDIFPTLLELVGLQVPEGHQIDGRSLKTLLAGKADPDHPDHFLMHYPHGPHRSNYFTVWRNGAWKVVYHYTPEVFYERADVTKPSGRDALGQDQPSATQEVKARVELYNLSEDPFEQRDLAASMPEKAAKMLDELVAELNRHGAQLPTDRSGRVLKPTL